MVSHPLASRSRVRRGDGSLDEKRAATAASTARFAALANFLESVPSACQGEVACVDKHLGPFLQECSAAKETKTHTINYMVNDICF